MKLVQPQILHRSDLISLILMGFMIFGFVPQTSFEVLDRSSNFVEKNRSIHRLYSEIAKLTTITRHEMDIENLYKLYDDNRLDVNETSILLEPFEPVFEKLLLVSAPEVLADSAGGEDDIEPLDWLNSILESYDLGGELRHFSILLCLKAKCELARGNVNQALEIVIANTAMGKHLASAPYTFSDGVFVIDQSLNRFSEIINAAPSDSTYWQLVDCIGERLTNLEPALSSRRVQYLRMIPALAQATSEVRNKTQIEQLNIAAATLYDQLDLEPHSDTVESRQSAIQASNQIEWDKCDWTEEQLSQMPQSQIAVLSSYYSYRDRLTKLTLLCKLPWNESRLRLRATAIECKKFDDLTSILVADGFISRFIEFDYEQMCKMAINLDRRAAMIRQAAAIGAKYRLIGGRLPSELSEFLDIPIAKDPATGKSLIYEKTATGFSVSLPNDHWLGDLKSVTVKLR